MSDFWAQPSKVKARKSHRCVICNRVIDAGETYSRGFGVYDGRASTWKQCLHCLYMLDRIDYDDTYGEDDYDCFEPRDLEELRVFVHYRKRWRNNAGELYPLPFQAKVAGNDQQ